MLTCLINGTKYELVYPISVSEMAGNNISSDISVKVSDCCMQAPNTPIPKAGDLIEILEDGSTVFLGTCGIPTSPKIDSVHTPLIYRIKCGNGNSLLARRIVNYGTQGKTITQIVEYLYETYVRAEGISKGIISQVPITLDAYTAADMNLQDVLNELSGYVSGAWQVTNERVFNFIAEEDFSSFSTVITKDNFLGAEIQTQTKDQDVRTAQTVKGLMAVTDTQTENFKFDGEKDEFETLFPIVQKPTQIKRTDGVILDQSRIGVKGLDDSNANIVFLFAFNSRTLEYNTSSGWLSTNQGFSVSYIGQFPIRVRSFNIEKITEIATHTGTSGMIDNVHEDNTLTTVADAQLLADSLLENYGKERSEIKFWIRSTQLLEQGYSLDDFSLLKKFTFSMPEIGLVGDFVVTERTLESIAPAETWENSLKIHLKMVDRSFVKSYGQTLKALIKQQQRNIREDVIVVSQEDLEDTVQFTETMYVGYGYPAFWPVVSVATMNDPLSGLDIYPC